MTMGGTVGVMVVVTVGEMVGVTVGRDRGG